MSDQRSHDIVLFGATGFTGALTAEYLARNAPENCRWALAGRNRAKLESLRARLAEITPALADLPLLHADVTEPESLASVAPAIASTTARIFRPRFERSRWWNRCTGTMFCVTDLDAR